MKTIDVVNMLINISNMEFDESDQCVQIAKDYAEQEAIEFAMSISTHCYCELGNDTRSYKELYQLFKNRENER